MSLTAVEIATVQSTFDADAHAQHALMLAQPNGGGLHLLVAALRLTGMQDAEIQKLAVFYSFDVASNPPSRLGATMPGQPVRGVLVADGGSGPNVAVLNATPAVADALRLPEVFPLRLEAVRQQWVACGVGLDAGYVAEASLRRGLRVSLLAFAGGPGDRNCSGSSCPAKVIVGSG